VRDRVAMAIARSTRAGLHRLVRVGVVLTTLFAALFVAAGAASADTGVAAASMPFPVGTVGIAVVVVGLGGLVTGLVRHRRREVAAAAILKRTAEPPIVEQAA
jgi:hypothetical protein